MNSLVILPVIVLVLANMSFADFHEPEEGSNHCTCEEVMHVRASGLIESGIIGSAKGQLNELTKLASNNLSGGMRLAFENVNSGQRIVSKVSFNPIKGLFDSNVNLKDCDLRHL